MRRHETNDRGSKDPHTNVPDASEPPVGASVLMGGLRVIILGRTWTGRAAVVRATDFGVFDRAHAPTMIDPDRLGRREWSGTGEPIASADGPRRA